MKVLITILVLITTLLGANEQEKTMLSLSAAIEAEDQNTNAAETRESRRTFTTTRDEVTTLENCMIYAKDWERLVKFMEAEPSSEYPRGGFYHCLDAVDEWKAALAKLEDSEQGVPVTFPCGSKVLQSAKSLKMADEYYKTFAGYYKEANNTKWDLSNRLGRRIPTQEMEASKKWCARYIRDELHGPMTTFEPKDAPGTTKPCLDYDAVTVCLIRGLIEGISLRQEEEALKENRNDFGDRTPIDQHVGFSGDVETVHRVKGWDKDMVTEPASMEARMQQTMVQENLVQPNTPQLMKVPEFTGTLAGLNRRTKAGKAAYAQHRMHYIRCCEVIAHNLRYGFITESAATQQILDQASKHGLVKADFPSKAQLEAHLVGYFQEVAKDVKAEQIKAAREASRKTMAAIDETESKTRKARKVAKRGAVEFAA